MGKFADSTKSLKRQLVREYIAQYGQTPDEGQMRQFDDAIRTLQEKRESDYVRKIMRTYPRGFVEKVFDYMGRLSPLEMDGLTFEDACGKFIEAHPDKVDSHEISQFFDKKTGKFRKFTPSPDEIPLGEIGIDAEGRISEKPRTLQQKVSKEPPTLEEAKRMSSKEIAQFLPHGNE